MATASAFTAGLFASLVLLAAGVVVHAFRRAGLGPLAAAGVLLVYVGIPGALAASGALDRYDPLPAPALLLLLALTLLTIGLALSPVGARLAAALSVGAVVAFQAFRIPVELLLHELHVEGVIPVQMTYTGRNFDIVTGISGLLLGIWILRRGSVPRGAVLLWNLLGLALLVNIVVIAMLSTPVPFRRFVESAPHTLPSTFPFIWLPSFLVQVALASHLLVFRQLMGRRAVHDRAPAVA